MNETTKCPYCGGEILAVAKKCKHCKQWLTNDDVDVTDSKGKESQGTNVEPSQDDSNSVQSDKSNNVSAPEPSTNVNTTKRVLVTLGIIAVVLVILFLSGVFDDKEADSNPTSQNVSEQVDLEKIEATKAEVKQSVEEMYADVFKDYDKNKNYEAQYFSTDFYNTYVEARDLAKEKKETLLDYDLWHQKKDWGDMSIEVSNVDISGPTYEFPIVKVDLIDKKNGSESRLPIELMMRKEKQSWKITDIRTNPDSNWEGIRWICYIKDNSSPEESHVSQTLTIKDAIELNKSVFLSNTDEYGINEYQLRIPNELSNRLSTFSVINGVEIERTETFMAIYYVDCSVNANSYPKPTNKETACWIGVNADGETVMQVYSKVAMILLTEQISSFPGAKKIDNAHYITKDADIQIKEERGGFVFYIKETE